MPDSAVIVQLRSFKASLLREESTQMREMAQRWLQVERALDGNMAALAERMSNIARDGGTVTGGMLWQESRYRILLSQLTDELGKYTRYADRTITDRQAQLARLGIDHAVSAIEAQGVRSGFARLPVEAVQNMVGLAGDGSPLRTLLQASWPDAAQGMTNALVRGVALGWNPRKTARAMAAGSTRSLDRMMKVARTESLRVYRESSRQSYINSGVVTGYARIATHDKRVCPACLMDEGHVYELNEEMPEHVQGRCSMIPYCRGVPNPQWKKGEEWFNEQDAATQTSILGKGKYEAWQAGRFDLGELVTVKPNATWGDSLQVTSLRDLTGPRVARAIDAIPVTPTVPKFATVAEAQQWAIERKLAKAVDYSGVTPDAANILNEEIHKVFGENSPIRNIVTGRGGMPGVLMEVTDQLDFHVYRVARDVDSVAKDLATNEAGYKIATKRTNRAFMARDYKELVIHELGHAADFSYGKTQRIGRFWHAERIGAKQSGNLAEGKLTPAAKKEAANLSDYATTNFMEYFAEAFTAIRTGRADLVPAHVVRLIEEALP